MASKTRQATKSHEKLIGALRNTILLQQRHVDALQEQIAELHLRVLFLLRHTPVRHHKAGILDPKTNAPVTELTTMYVVYLEQADAFAEAMAKEAEGGEPAPTLSVRRSTEQAVIG